MLILGVKGLHHAHKQPTPVEVPAFCGLNKFSLMKQEMGVGGKGLWERTFHRSAKHTGKRSSHGDT